VILPSQAFELRHPEESLLKRTFRRPGLGRGAHLAARSGLEIRHVAPHKTPIGRERDGYERAVLDLVLGGSATDP
jgi:hypothetical protein